MGGNEQQWAFDGIKQLMANCETLAYLNPSADTTVIADAKPLWFGSYINHYEYHYVLRTSFKHSFSEAISRYHPVPYYEL